ncbi:type B DNA-directed DNA polymerase [Halorussus salilacus]|uniref:type B DNA-directed DNA polymerase n=1 Tax=Halorussus salilacus TaxID=2953750 RepID=UPI00209F8E9D|nr:type B DNA-directed DNA polymerase [Halorussus salilacus]USZ67387.1 type B DNA-directed DNA polymerase [Halorussus salilacus]
MPYKIDFFDDEVVEWSLTDDGADAEQVLDYTPTFYVGRGEGDRDSLADARDALKRFPTVARTAFEEWRPGFRHDAESVLRVDVTSVEEVSRMARWIREWGEPGEYRCFNVDFSREFRYCLENGLDPTPSRDLRTLSIEGRASEFTAAELPALTVGGGPVARSPVAALPELERRIDRADPDVLVVDSAKILAGLHEVAEGLGYDLQLGRQPGFQKLAGRSTYTSYGRVGHSPARYNVPGRAIIDRSNTFLYAKSNLAGCLSLVGRSWKPIQELGWASIGNVLTAIQIREALDRNVLVPWKAWRPELFKSMGQLHEADRGGFTFSPDVGLHEGVHELDFSSLYPNIICTRNVSPETIRCACHSERDDVPGIGYSICDDPGYLPDVLAPLIDDRDETKGELRVTDDEERRRELEGRSDAIKWILVSCFGYQGFSNAKFGRIECHEAINAFAREILLDAKEALEAGGWRIVHGIVDSVWVTARENDDQRPLDELASEISEDVGIRLEYEAAYDWVAFVPLRDSEAGALTKYFGALSGGGDDRQFKYRGIECRQRSTPPFVADVQEDLVAVLDETRSPEAVTDRLRRALGALREGRVDPGELVVEQRTSKRADEYARATRTVAALERATGDGRDVRPGQGVEYVVVDDSKRSRERVQLADEAETYDAEFYVGEVLRAAESVLSPLGWRREYIEACLAERTDASLGSYG